MSAPETGNTDVALAGPILLTRQASAIKPEPVDWLWDNRIPRGVITMLAGPPKSGKSQLTADWTARITKATPWPDGSSCPRGRVLVATAEDMAAKTLVPRLVAASADMDMVEIIDGIAEDGEEEAFHVRHVDALRRKLEEREFKLIVIDPVASFAGGVRDNNDGEVRAAMAPLGKLAEEFNIAIVTIRHINKNTAHATALSRINGAVAWGALARANWLAIPSQENRERRLFLNAGCNLGPDPGGLAYEVVGLSLAPSLCDGKRITTSLIDWVGPDNTFADDVLAPADPDAYGVDDWVKDFLAGGEMDGREIYRAGGAEGYAKRTIQRALRRIRAVNRPEGFGRDRRTYWRLGGCPSAPFAPHNLAGANGANGAFEASASPTKEVSHRDGLGSCHVPPGVSGAGEARERREQEEQG